MSGGFFRGTSADQDTRFSNKQAKLLKSQKFPIELDSPVDMSKVKMDVMKPWIANRVTQLLEIEDEVLINFIYGLLEGKVVDGKQIQIQLTGFMEKNTGKFMKELWSLLLSAQNNASGIPQQFLDEKEEELRKSKAESERITIEIQKKREKERRESEVERQKGEDAAPEKFPKGFSAENSKEDKEQDNGRNIRENRTLCCAVGIFPSIFLPDWQAAAPRLQFGLGVDRYHDLEAIHDQEAYLNPQSEEGVLCLPVELMDVPDPLDAPYLLVDAPSLLVGVRQGVLDLLPLEGDHLCQGEDHQHPQDIGHLHRGGAELHFLRAEGLHHLTGEGPLHRFVGAHLLFAENPQLVGRDLHLHQEDEPFHL